MDPPRITRHPENKSVATGRKAVFVVEATGDDLKFQWQKDGECIRNEPWFHCSQTNTTSTLCIENASKDDKGRYKCVVENLVEMSGKASDEAELLVCELSLDVCRIAILPIDSFTCRLLLNGTKNGRTFHPVPPTQIPTECV